MPSPHPQLSPLYQPEISKVHQIWMGPVYKQSFKATPLDLANASYTTLSLMAALSLVNTG